MAKTKSPTPTFSAGLDIGTDKVCAVISCLDETGRPSVLSSASVPSRGIRKGVVVNLEQAAVCASAVLEKAQMQAGVQVDDVILGISGGHIESTKSKGVIAVSTRQGITQNDVQRVLDAAAALVLPPDREIIHIIPQGYKVDDEEGVKNPVGMTGSRLEVNVHIITVAAASVSNLIKSVYKAGYETSDIVLKTLASSQAILSEDEKDEGCCLIDLGAGTTDYVIFYEGGMRHTGQIGLGGSHVTSDIAYGLKTTSVLADQLKHRYGCAVATLVPLKEYMELPNPAGRARLTESRRILAEIMQPRIEEILFLLNEEITKTGLKSRLSSGVILTGGGANTEHIETLAAEIFNLPVRVGYPVGIGGLTDLILDPASSTAAGLSLVGLKGAIKMESISGPDEDKNFQTIIGRIKEWFNEFF
ncbi:MAG: cell division protein FtsA [Brevinema sp.]